MDNKNNIRNAGLITVTGSLIGVGVSIARTADTSFPTFGSVSLGEILTVIAFVTLFFGAIGLSRSGASGNSSGAKIGYGVVLLGLVVATIYEITLILQSQPSELPGILSGLLVGLGMLMVGVVVVQAQRWHGWRRFAPLLIGSYPLLMVFTYPLLESIPAVADMNTLNLDQALTAIWFSCWLPLGMALSVETGQEESGQPELAG